VFEFKAESRLTIFVLSLNPTKPYHYYH